MQMHIGMETEVETDYWGEIERLEAETDAAVQCAAIRPLLKTALAKLVGGDVHEGLYDVAAAFGFASDQEHRHEVTRKLCAELSHAFDRLWLRFA